MKNDDNKVESDLKNKNVDMISNLTKVTSKLETKKLQYAKLDKYNTILEG